MVFRRAAEISRTNRKITCLHIMAAILENPGPVIITALKAIGTSADEMADPVSGWIEIMNIGGNAFGPAVDNREVAHAVDDLFDKGKGRGHTPYIDKYCRDLTREAVEGKLGPYLERRKELLQMIRILCRHKKSNPFLVGEAGAGKTTIVESLAIRIAGPKAFGVPGYNRLVELNIAPLIANTGLRGDLEGRLTRILDEAIAHGNIILFVDGINLIVGKGTGNGTSLDVAGILKPYLERGLKCIGASTMQEYLDSVNDDPTMEKLFETILIDEPDRDETLEMLKVRRPPLEEHHMMRIPDQVLEAAIDLSMRFDACHVLPDKAIRLLDTACADARITTLSMCSMEKPPEEMTASMVAETIATRRGLPLEIVAGHLDNMPLSRLLTLQPFLSERIIGQEEAIERVCHRLFVAYAGLEKRKGPLAVFLFMGRTGVGKTRMAKLLAEFFLGKDSDIIRLDMSEYSEENSVTRLIGSPPGYVGYGEGQLVRMLREKHYSVVLFDEVEKANPKVFDIFLQLFDEGRITDSKGRTADARNTIFIMTSNLEPETGLSYGEIESNRRHRGTPTLVKKGDGLKIFRKELINRMDEIIVFNSLDISSIRKILDNILRDKAADLEKSEHISLVVSDDARAFIAASGYRLDEGVRALERAVSNLLYEPLSKLILTGKIKCHKRWLAIYDERGISIVPDDQTEV